MFEKLPKNLPQPQDDGASDHLTGKTLPDLSLPSTSHELINLSHWSGWMVIYCYPMTGQPGKKLPGGWDAIPGARGCTPQSCSFRNHYEELKNLGAAVFGLSTQTTSWQLEAKTRLHLPFDLLSDAQLNFQSALSLPTFGLEDRVVLKRLTLIVRNGMIVNCFYPVFPPDKNAEEVILWLSSH